MMNKNICRFCLRENSLQTYKIFDECSKLREDLKSCLPAALKCECNDGLPQTICELCWWQVYQIKNFHRQCLLADEELRSRYAEYKNQAVEEVLGLIEKLRQEDFCNKCQDNEICDNKQESQCLLEIAKQFEISQSNCDSELYSSSLDSGIFEDDMPMGTLTELQNFSEKDMEINKSTEVCLPAGKTNECENSAKRKSYKGPFSCNYCDKKFTRNFQLKLHLISVHQMGDGLQYSCELCSKIFASNHSLSYHQKSVHYQEKPHFCLMCDRQFVLKSQLASHMRTHTGESKPRIFECQECGKKWPTKSDLKTHMRSHDPNMERPFKCDRCEKSFFTRGHLSSHQLVHTGEKPFACEFCERSYQSIGNLNNHLGRRHIKKTMYKEQNSLKTAEIDTARNA